MAALITTISFLPLAARVAWRWSASDFSWYGLATASLGQGCYLIYGFGAGIRALFFSMCVVLPCTLLVTCVKLFPGQPLLVSSLRDRLSRGSGPLRSVAPVLPLLGSLSFVGIHFDAHAASLCRPSGAAFLSPVQTVAAIFSTLAFVPLAIRIVWWWSAVDYHWLWLIAQAVSSSTWLAYAVLAHDDAIETQTLVILPLVGFMIVVKIKVVPPAHHFSARLFVGRLFSTATKDVITLRTERLHSAGSAETAMGAHRLRLVRLVCPAPPWPWALTATLTGATVSACKRPR